jgi:F0F1-type ATP synthase alpha subunit
VVGPKVGLEVCGKKPDITQVVLLVNDPPDVPSRFPINSNMHTGFTAVDAFTPIGRGQSMMIESIHPEARTKFGVNTVLAQKQTGVRESHL